MNENSEHQEIEKLLQEEVDRLNRSTRNNWIGGAIVSLFLLGYLSFLFVMVKTFLEPGNAAFLLSSQVEESVPEFLGDMEATLIARAPQIADNVSKPFIRAIPQLRKLAEEQLDFSHQEMIPHLSREFQNIITSYISDSSHVIKELVLDTQTEGFADAFTEDMMSSLSKLLEEAIIEHYEGRDYKYFKENSLNALQAMNEHLGVLLDQDVESMERKERLQRRILAAVVMRFLDYKEVE